MDGQLGLIPRLLAAIFCNTRRLDLSLKMDLMARTPGNIG
jgi:hypothetical protein